MLSCETIEIYPSPLAISHRISNSGREVYFNTSFYTFGKVILTLAAELLDISFLTDFEKEVFLKKICEKYFEKNRKGYFAGVYGRPGFVKDIKKAVKTLKKAGVNAEDLKVYIEECEHPEMDRRRLLDLYAIYFQYTKSRKDYDDMGWLVVDALKKSNTLPLFLRVVKKVIVRSRYQITDVQLKLLEVLCAKGIKVVVMFPFDESNPAFEVAKTAAEYLKNIKSKNLKVDFKVESSARYPCDLFFAQEHFFKPPEKTFEPKDNSLLIVEAANRDFEIREIAFCIKKLLTESQDLKPVDIVLIVKDIAKYDDYIREHFKRAKIPFFFRRGKQLQRTNFYKDIMLVLSAGKDNFRREDISRIISAPYFVDFGVEKDKAEQILCLSGYFSFDNESIDKRLKWLKEYAGQFELFKKRLILKEDIEKVRNFLIPFIDEIPLKETRKTVFEFTGWLKEFIEKYYVCERNREQKEKVLSLVDEMLMSNRKMPGREKISTSRFKEMLESLAERETVSGEKNISAVNVLTPFDTDGLGFKVGIFCGMVDDEFPRKKMEAQVLKDKDINGINKVLEKKGYLPIQKSTDEGLLDRNVFYRSMLSISKSCIFTVPFTSETREDKRRSIFLEELEFLFSNVKDGKLISGLKKKSIPPSRIILPVEKTASKTEFEISLANTLKDKNIEVEPVSIKSEITRYKPVFLRNPNLESTAGNRYFRGIYSSQDLKKNLNNLFFKDGRFIFSPSMIEQFLRCPYRFFMQYLQKLKVFPRPEFEMNIMNEGIVTHAILERFCGERETGDINPEKRIEKIAGEFFSDYEKEHFTGRKELWVVKKEGILQTVKNFLLLEEKSSIGPGKTKLVDVEYKVDNCIVDLDGEKIALRGVIDRIDCASDGTIYVIDYKTSSKPRKDKDYQQGYLAQAALYKLILLNREVAENLKLEDIKESKIKACYFALKADPYNEKAEYFTEIAASSDWKEILKDKIMRFKHAVEKMEFPAEPIDIDSDRRECGYCDFAYLCRIGEDWNG